MKIQLQWRVQPLCICLLTAIWICVGCPVVLWAQGSGSIAGCIITADTDQPAEGVNVVVVGTLHGGVTGSDGCFEMEGVEPGTYTVRAHVLDYGRLEEEVTVSAGETTHVELRLQPEAPEIGAVDLFLPYREEAPGGEIFREEVREYTVHHAGDALRRVPGADSGRQGSTGFVPGIRGLWGHQVPVFVDGIPMISGSFVHLDPSLSRVEPFSVERIRTAGGPYALAHTWGMSAVFVETVEPVPEEPLHVTARTGYQTNKNALETGGQLRGSAGSWAGVFAGSYRRSGDYRSGAGIDVPASFESGSGTGRLLVGLTRTSDLTLTGQYQRDSEASFPAWGHRTQAYDAYGGAVRYRGAFTGPIRAAEIRLYAYRTDHTLQQDTTLSPATQGPQLRGIETRNNGLRATIEPRPVIGSIIQVGIEGQWQTERIAPRASVPLPGGEQENIWPDASRAQAGLFLQATRQVGTTEVIASTRVNGIQTRLQTTDQVDSDKMLEALWSGSIIVQRPLADRWTLSAAAGTAARPPAPMERASVRQYWQNTRHVVVGNANLNTERSFQGDLWVDGEVGRMSVRIGGFVRRMTNALTVSSTSSQPDTLLPTLINEHIDYLGGELSAVVHASLGVSLEAWGSYVWAREEGREIPAFARPASTAQLKGRLRPFDGALFMAGTLRGAARQANPFTELDGPSTGAYITVDLSLGIPLAGGASLSMTLENIFNTNYANPLNAYWHQPSGAQEATASPEMSRPFPEPGRTFSIRLLLER